MNEEAFARIKNMGLVDAEPRISVDDGPDRTLVYGWSSAIGDGQNRTWHVYSEDGLLNLFVYGGPRPTGEIRVVEAGEITKTELASSTDSILISGTELPVGLLLPPKRAYPAACDESFCARLIKLGAHISFTTYEAREEKAFHGLRASELSSPTLRP
jgi:hypothetical protein